LYVKYIHYIYTLHHVWPSGFVTQCQNLTNFNVIHRLPVVYHICAASVWCHFVVRCQNHGVLHKAQAGNAHCNVCANSLVLLCQCGQSSEPNAQTTEWMQFWNCRDTYL